MYLYDLKYFDEFLIFSSIHYFKHLIYKLRKIIFYKLPNQQFGHLNKIFLN